jgi:hypothetical protein
MKWKTKEKTYMYVGADLFVRNRTFSWGIGCPFCGRLHLHPAGTIRENPRRFLSHRLSPCIHARPELQAAAQALNFYDSAYILVDRIPDATSRFIAEERKRAAAARKRAAAARKLSAAAYSAGGITQ